MKKFLLLALFGLSFNSFGQNYKLVSTKGYRYDNARYLLVVGKKPDVKTIINEIYHILGTKKFSVMIVDNQEAANYELMEFRMERLNREQSNYLNKHIVAMFDGLLETSGQDYVLTYGSDGDDVTYEPK